MEFWPVVIHVVFTFPLSNLYEGCFVIHLCGVFPGSCVLCNEVDADTGSMHCHRTATGKHKLDHLLLAPFSHMMYDVSHITLSLVVKGWGRHGNGFWDS